MIGGHAKVKVFLPEHDDYLDVFMKTVKDGRSAITRVGLESCVPSAWRRAQYGHSASPSPATRMSFASLFTVFSTTEVHHSLLGASVVLQYMYLCIELCTHG